MESTAEMLDALRARAGSDGKAAALLGVSQVTYSRWRSPHTPDLPSDENGVKIAELLQLDPAYVLAVVNGERAKSQETRATWRRMADAFGKAAMFRGRRRRPRPHVTRRAGPI
jgi:DNA-binding transcriptional regulator YdaS (Cro superfamily)